MADPTRPTETAAEIAARQAEIQYVQQQMHPLPANPLHGGSVYEPESYMSYRPTPEQVAADPRLAEPLPSGRGIDPNIPSPLNAARQKGIAEFYKDPKKYVQGHATVQLNEQSIIDKGKSMLGHLLDYRDDSDLQVFGVNLSAVESVWDSVVGHITGTYDVVNVGLGWAASALPGGIQTLDGGQLSGEKTFLQVFNGDMNPGDAPSVGQILIANAAADAKRIRSGSATLSSVLASAASGPLVLAALAAPDSPLQQEGFNILDKDQREKAFGAGWEHWTSGITDFGMSFADPLIVAGVGAKALRLGALAARGSAKDAALISHAVHSAVDELHQVAHGQALERASAAGIATPEAPPTWDEVFNDAAEQSDIRLTEPDRTHGSTVGAIMDSGTAPKPLRMPEITSDMVKPKKFDNVLSSLIWDIAVKDKETGRAIMSVEEIMARPEIKATTNPGGIASLLHTADTPMMVALVLDSVHGAKDASKNLSRLAPSLADETLKFVRENNNALSYITDGTKRGEVSDILHRMQTNVKHQYNDVKMQIEKLSPGATRDTSLIMDVPEEAAARAGATGNELSVLWQRYDTLKRTHEEITEMMGLIKGTAVDPLSPTSRLGYSTDEAKRILADLHSRNDVMTRALNDDIYEAAKEARMWLPGKDNAYSRMVMASRERRTTSAFRYAQEGTGLKLPKRQIVRTVIDASGNPVHEFDNEGWFASSHFDNNTLLDKTKRVMRVWRWMGTETPSGYISLKGTNTIGSEREFMAALDLDMYRGEAKIVEKPRIGADGKPLKAADGTVIMDRIEVGGAAKKAEYTQRFMAALNNPQANAFTELKRIEADVMMEMADLFGHRREDFEGLLDIANGARMDNLRVARKENYYVDPHTGEIDYVPFSNVHLANGTYMQNFTELERLLTRAARKDNGDKLRAAFQVPMDTAGHAYEMFNSFWRPATLLRLGYTTRNVFEAMIRAMAYNGSLVPVTWPFRASFDGTKNAIIKRVVEKEVKATGELITESSFRRVEFHEFNQAANDYHRMASAYELKLDGDTDPMMYVFKKNVGSDAEYERLSKEDWEAKLTQSHIQMKLKEAKMQAAEGNFAAAVKGTKFGDWRLKQIDDLTAQLKEYETHLDNLTQMMDMVDSSGKKLRLESEPYIVSQIADLTEMTALAREQLDAIRYHPDRSLAEYKTQAGRQKRIGSGTSMGPDGGYYSNAWEGPLERINRGNMSADGTTKQRMSLVADAYHGLLSRTLEMTNEAIPYNELKPQQWAAGMAHVIEQASSNPLVQFLVHNDWDIEKAYRWMQYDEAGKAHAHDVSHLFAEDMFSPITLSSPGVGESRVRAQGMMVNGQRVRTQVYVHAEHGDTGLRPFQTTFRDIKGGHTTTYDPQQVRHYVAEVSNRARLQMQNRQEFFSVLERRVNEKTGMVAKSTIRSGNMNRAGASVRDLTGDDIIDILNGMSKADKDALEFTQGSKLIAMGTAKPAEMYRKAVDVMFRILGTIPEDAVTRGPFYADRFKVARNNMISAYWERNGKTLDEVKAYNKGIRGSDGALKPGSLAHPEFTIPSSELNRIIEQAHRVALRDTKEWMYTIDRRTNLGKYGEWIFPFISATQNSTTVVGKLLYKQPWLAPFVHDLWNAPQRAGFKDDEGNLHIVIPENWVTNTLKNNPDIPFFGGALNDKNELVIPENGLNVIAPETGFGFAPQPAPLIQVAASELMKANWLPVETPQLLVAALGQDGADQMWQTTKDYLFGEGQSLSSETGSWDKLAPAWIKRLWTSKNEMSSEYGYAYSLEYQTQLARYKGGERDHAPTEDEVNKSVTNQFLFRMLGNLGIPTPFTPYPIITPPQIKNPSIQILADTLTQYKKADPMNGAQAFQRDFGEWALPMASTKVTVSAGGASLTPESVSDITTFDALLRDTAPDLGNNTDVLGILTNNRADMSTYDRSSSEWQSAHTIPGTSIPWRPVLTGSEALMEEQRVAGWTMYRRIMDGLDARLAAAGFTSYEAAGAAQYKLAKKQAIVNLMQNPDYGGWLIDYQDRSGDRAISAVRVLEKAVDDPQFIRKMNEWGKTNTLACMTNYISFRQTVVNAVQQSGVGLADPRMANVKLAWDIARQKLKNSDVRWKEIVDTYLTGDDDPVNPGQFSDVFGGPIQTVNFNPDTAPMPQEPLPQAPLPGPDPTVLGSVPQATRPPVVTGVQ